MFERAAGSYSEVREKFTNWSMKYVLDTLEAGRAWYPPGHEPAGTAFAPMLEAEKTYRHVSAKAKRLITDGFTARWSPDGTKLAFGTGFHGYSGVAVWDAQTEQTSLLIVPGKDPVWSPDGRYLVFVRDCLALPVSELAGAEREHRHRAREDEEVWIMKADGTEPKRLTSGRCPRWSREPNHIYFYSLSDSALCEMSIVDNGSQPRLILKCADTLPEISPDKKYVACIESMLLKVLELASGSLFAELTFPSQPRGKTWSSDGRELCFGAASFNEIPSGLWVRDLDKKQTRKVLEGPIWPGSLAPGGTQLVFNLEAPYFEIWVADLDPNTSIVESLGPGLTLEEHLQQQLALYTQRIEANPEDANNYYLRARCHDYLGNRASANADMRRWSAVVSEGLALDSARNAPRDRRRVVNLPFDCQLVFSAERPVDTIPMMSVAFGQKGRCNMKVLEIPVFVMSLFGFGLLSSVGAPPAYADFTFGEPVGAPSDFINCFSADGLEMYVGSTRPGGYGQDDLWVLTRTSADAAWGAPENLGPLVNGPNVECMASISSDGLTLYFNSDRSGGHGPWDIYVTTRPTRSDPWARAVNAGSTINSAYIEGLPWITPDGRELYFVSNRLGGYGQGDIWVAKRQEDDDVWQVPENLGPLVNSPYQEHRFSLSPDGLLLVFTDGYWASDTPRPGGYGGNDMWVTRRADLSDPWQVPVNLGPKVNGPAGESDPRISADGRTLYFWSNRSGNWNAYQAPIVPVVDFNGDGQVDGRELAVMIVEFGGTDALCDIAPFAWGDGVVDFEDLKVLAEYIGKEVVDGTLIAHWKLDETEGMVAADSAGDSDGTVMGNAAWQPDGGKVDGALEFDGVDDFVVADSPVGLGDGPFSVCAWVKGGAPGRAIVSLGGGARWLYTNPIDGSLMTDLSASAGAGTPLFSDVVVTDGQWHRVVLVWDGTSRILCVDEEEAAREPLSEVSALAGKLIIGGSGSLEQGSLWSGLIDDVRIYNRAVKP